MTKDTIYYLRSSNMNYRTLWEEIERDEGRRRKPYTDTAGKLTIGVGWNLSDNGLPDDVINDLLARSLEQAEFDARYLVPSFEALSDARQRALVNMAFNLGRVRLAGFKQMLAAIAAQQFDKAADAMLDSRWAAQVGKRASRLARMMREG